VALLRVDRRLERGKFWEFTPKQFPSQPKVNRDHIMKCAEEIDLDMGRFEMRPWTPGGQAARQGAMRRVWCFQTIGAAPS
jgi:hypothetical protein